MNQSQSNTHARNHSAYHNPFALVAIDIDGTLLRSDKTISPRNAQAIHAALEQGAEIVLASARPPRAVRHIYNALGLSSLQINYNGALIHDTTRRQHTYHQPLPPEITQQVFNLARTIDPDVIVNIEALDRWYTDRVDPNLNMEVSTLFEPDWHGPLDDYLNEPATKIMFLAPPSRIEPVQQAIEHNFAQQVAIAVSDPHLIQVIHPSVDKANALRMIAESKGYSPQQVMAIGDAPNDAGMLRWAGLGIAVENAWPQAREAADTTAPSNDQDGVAHALEQYILQ